MQTLFGRVAAVVAASDGVGAAIARCFGELGASVVVNYASDKAGAERVVAKIVRSGGRAVAFQSDMANEADFGNAVSCARLNFGNAIICKMSPRQGQKKTIFQSSVDTSPKQIPHSRPLWHIPIG